MHVSPTFVAHTQATKLMQPGEGALDHPARHTQVAAMASETFADLRRNLTLPQDTAIPFAVVTAIGLYTVRLA